MKQRIFIEATSVLFIIVFLYTGLSKLQAHLTFIYTIGWWAPLKPLAPLISYAVPAALIGIAILMLFDRFKLLAMTGAMSMMLIFIGYISFMKIHETNLPCSCGGIIAILTWNQQLMVNIVLLMMSVFSWRMLRKRKSGNEINILRSEPDSYLTAADSLG